jgi:hypothetical protein
MRATLAHKLRVADLLARVASNIVDRAIHHDDSKFSEQEFELFSEQTARLKGLTYGSPEYKAALKALGPALEHHYAVNRHHPEHTPEGIDSMTLLDVVEMLCDWKAATERHADGSLERSITQNAERFGYDDRFQRLLRNTAIELELIELEADDG